VEAVRDRLRSVVSTALTKFLRACVGRHVARVALASEAQLFAEEGDDQMREQWLVKMRSDSVPAPTPRQTHIQRQLAQALLGLDGA
jgi:hypothetical protein